MEIKTCCLQIFAREPVIGQVKTRIAAQIGTKPALSLYQALFNRTLEQVAAAPVSHRELWIDGNPDDPLFATAKPTYQLFVQQGRDLGERMRFALQQGLNRYDMVILIGTDCPSLDAAYLIRALLLLDGGTKVVFGPANDGGYVLLGLTAMIPELFESIPWGTEKVLQRSESRLHKLSIAFKLLEPLGDIDRLDDLPGLAGLSPPLVY